MNLTKNQKAILDFMIQHLDKHGYSPTHEEIMAEFGFKSKGTVQHYIVALEDKGALKRDWHKASGIKPTPLHDKYAVDLLGKVAAGVPIEHYKYDEKIHVPQDMLKDTSHHYALQVAGDSMVGEGILDGDFVIVREQTTARDGQVVVAMVEGAATIKRFFKKKTHIELHSANEKYKPILVDESKEFRVVGIFSGLIRRGH